MKAKIKLKNVEYFVDFNLRPLVINSVDKEIDEKTKTKIIQSIQKYIVVKYGKNVGDFYVKTKQAFIDYVNKSKEFRLINILDDFNVYYNSDEQRALYRMAYELENRGYIENIHKGKYKLIKEIPKL